MIGLIVGFIAFLLAWRPLDDMLLWPLALIADLVLWALVSWAVNAIIAQRNTRP